jgi:large subunit ribosomal protein L33
MARKGNRILVKLVNPKTGTFYVTSKNRINTNEKLKVKKFDPKAINEKTGKKGAHVYFEERKLA